MTQVERARLAGSVAGAQRQLRGLVFVAAGAVLVLDAVGSFVWGYRSPSIVAVVGVVAVQPFVAGWYNRRYGRVGTPRGGDGFTVASVVLALLGVGVFVLTDPGGPVVAAAGSDVLWILPLLGLANLALARGRSGALGLSWVDWAAASLMGLAGMAPVFGWPVEPDYRSAFVGLVVGAHAIWTGLADHRRLDRHLGSLVDESDAGARPS